MPSSFIHVVANDRISFFFGAKYYSSVCVCVCVCVCVFAVAQLVKNPPAIWETQVSFLGQEDPLEKG